MFKNMLKLALVSLLIYSQVAICSHEAAVVCDSTTRTVLVYRDFGHKGDENQIKGVLAAYSEIVPNVKITEFDVGQGNDLKLAAEKAVKTNKHEPVVLAAGEKTVEPFAALLPLKGAVTVHMSHMVTKDHPALVGKVDFIALPKHAISDFEELVKGSETHLIETIGVSHNRQIAAVEKAYQDNKRDIPDVKSFVAIMLGGDAPDENMKMKLYTQEDAQSEARYVAKIADGRDIIILNGPRTGKHDPKTMQEIKTAHRDGKPDVRTADFVNELKKSGVAPAQIILKDFQFDDKHPNMDIVLGAVRATDSIFLVPGESTSTISEAIDVLQPGKVKVYKHSAMSKVHEAHVQSELEAGRIELLDDSFKEVAASKKGVHKGGPAPSAAKTIALAISKAAK